MRKEWSPKWTGSSQPRKQRKYRYNAPLHVKRKFLSAHLSKELRERFGKRSVPLRKGDEVAVMKGGFRGFRGNIDRVNMSKSKVYVEGVKRKKVDGSEISIPLDPSNLMITKLSLEDKMRQAVFERSVKTEREEKPKQPEKPKEIQKKERVKKAERDHIKKPARRGRAKKPSKGGKDW